MITKSDSLNTFEFKKYFVILPNSDYSEFQKAIHKQNEIKRGKSIKMNLVITVKKINFPKR